MQSGVLLRCNRTCYICCAAARNGLRERGQRRRIPILSFHMLRRFALCRLTQMLCITCCGKEVKGDISRSLILWCNASLSPNSLQTDRPLLIVNDWKPTRLSSSRHQRLALPVQHLLPRALCLRVLSQATVALVCALALGRTTCLPVVLQT